LQRIREIAVAASNGTTSTDQFTAYKADLDGEIAAINNISANTKYGDQVLLDGSLSGAAFNIQIGANSGDSLDIKTAFADVSNTGLSVATALTSTTDAGTLLTSVDTALSTVAGKLATVGGFENTLQDQMNYLSVANENTSSAEAAIRNTDVASETANVARLQILQQAGAYALSQANSSQMLAARLLQ
jgi:flagellin